MDLSKSYDFFRPEEIGDAPVHIIGCGAVGSTIAENLVRFGVNRLTLWDFDIVEPHNIANQMYRAVDIGKKKVDALRDILTEIDPACAKNLTLRDAGWKGNRLSGFVFLAVDSIDLRREIVEKCQNDPYVKAFFDFRIGLTDAQHYAADWSVRRDIENFLATMQFTHEEAKASAPVSACNLELSVCPTIRMIVGAGVSNFINFVKGSGLKHLVLLDAFRPTFDAF